MPKIIGSSLKQHRSATRNLLFQALSNLLRERRFETLTMAEIAKTAGVGRTAVYNHFEDKEALLLAYITHETAKYSVDLQQALRSNRDPIARLRIYIRKQLEIGSTYNLAPGADLRQVVSQETGQKLHNHATVVEDILRTLLIDAMKQRAIERQNVPLVMALVNGAISGRTLPEDPREKELYILSLQSFILRALGASGAVTKIPEPRRFIGREVNLLESPFSGASEAEISGAACPIHHASH